MLPGDELIERVPDFLRREHAVALARDELLDEVRGMPAALVREAELEKLMTTARDAGPNRTEAAV